LDTSTPNVPPLIAVFALPAMAIAASAPVISTPCWAVPVIVPVPVWLTDSAPTAPAPV
jgi:hypothetical protein